MQFLEFIMKLTAPVPAIALGLSSFAAIAIGLILLAKSEWTYSPLFFLLAFCLALGWLFKQGDA